MRLSWTIMVLWWVVWTSFVSPDRIRTAPQLNSSEAIEQSTGTVIVAGEWIVWVVEVLPFRPAQVSFSRIVPRNSSRNVSETASVEVMELALMEDEAVQTLPTTCDALPKRSVSRDITDSFGMMK